MPAFLRSRIPQIIAAMPAQVTTAVHAGGEMIAEDARMRVPVDEGDLQDAIHVRKAELEAHVVAGNSEIYYGHMVEFGARSGPIQPFLVPAKEAREGDVVNGIANVLKAL